jgi:hypothetical protein
MFVCIGRKNFYNIGRSRINGRFTRQATDSDISTDSCESASICCVWWGGWIRVEREVKGMRVRSGRGVKLWLNVPCGVGGDISGG